MERYIREKRRAGLTSFGITHVFLAAYVRTVAKYPALNCFLSGQQVYSRGDDIQFCMMVKEEMSTDAAESAMKLHLTQTDSVEGNLPEDERTGHTHQGSVRRERL